MNFASDNVTGMAPEILAALEAANKGAAMPYGNDESMAALAAQVSELFEREVVVVPVATGTACNALALSSIVPPNGAVYCHREAHIVTSEANAVGFYSNGAQLVTLEGAHGKFAAATFEDALAAAHDSDAPQPAAVSLTQVTEAGTLYKLDEIAAIAAVARRHGLVVHLDGARFANAVAALGCSPAEASWKAGVDVLSLGATKNGCLAAEAIVFFRPELARETGWRRKRGGHVFSKHRFLAAQLRAYFEGDLWLRHARHANAQARALADGLARVPGVEIHHPVEASMIFARLPAALAEGLEAAGFRFYRWGPGGSEVRLVCAFNTAPEDVAAFLETARRLAGGAEARRA